MFHVLQVQEQIVEGAKITSQEPGERERRTRLHVS